MTSKEAYLSQKDEIMVMLKSYHSQKVKYGIEEFQDFRDNLSHKFLIFGEGILAELRAEAELAKLDSKICVKESEEELINKYDRVRGSASRAEREALIECKGKFREEVEAHKLYQKAKGLHEGVKEELNAVSSRLKHLIGG